MVNIGLLNHSGVFFRFSLYQAACLIKFRIANVT